MMEIEGKSYHVEQGPDGRTIYLHLQREGPNQGGQIAKVYSGTFCPRSLYSIDISNPVSEQWYSAHVVPVDAVQDDVRRRNAALQQHLKSLRAR